MSLLDADRKAIEDVIERYRRAVLAADWNAWGATLSPNVFFSPAFEPPHIGRQAAVDWVATFPNVVGFSVHIDEMDGSGDFAFARGRYELEFQMPDGSAAADRGCWLQTHQRTPGGGWLYSNAMFHSTNPPPQ